MHTARHTFATQSLLRGMPIEVLQKVLGHANIKTTMIYAKVVEGLPAPHHAAGMGGSGGRDGQRGVAGKSGLRGGAGGGLAAAGCSDSFSGG